MAQNDYNIKVFLNGLRQKGYLSYEYNPFYNYQTGKDIYKVETDIGDVLVPKGEAVSVKTGQLLTKKRIKRNNTTKTVWFDSRGNEVSDYKEAKEGDLYAQKGSLLDLDTTQLDFDLNHPVDITVQPSYDGSVNLILNDDKNIPRLINSRFSVREKNTYEIVDRIGENDTNIYNSDTFDKDTSLYFQYEYNPIIEYQGYIKGVMNVGQYCFYFTYCDADNNESDYIAESGLIPIFKGSDSDPFSIDGGIKNEITDKGIKLKLSNTDTSYNYLKIYYVRYFADYGQNRVFECKKIYKRFPINSNVVTIQITGNEESEDMDANILNVSRFNPKSILTQAQCKNMLFFGNIVKNMDNYKELTDCSLRIIPEIFDKSLNTINNEYYSTNGEFGYYESSNIYNNVGYFNEEYYRFGVVYIYQNGTLSNVYNTLGGTLKENNIPTCEIPLTQEENGFVYRSYISVDDEGWIKENNFSNINYANARGVCKLDFSKQSVKDNSIFGVKFNIPQDVVDYLKEELGIRGMFFVRQKCIPNIIAQCYLLPVDELLQAPVLQVENNYYTESFLTQGTIVTKDIIIPGTSIVIDQKKETLDGELVTNVYEDRLYKYKHSTNASESSISRYQYAGICPDFLLNQPYYNQIFNGNQFKLQKIKHSKLEKNGRFYTETENLEYDKGEYKQQVTINSVTDDVPTIAIKDKVYKLEIGKAEESFRFKYIEIDNSTYNAGDEDYDKINKATNLARGMYSPYLAVYSTSKLDTCCLYNIYQNISLSTFQEYQNRMDSSEPFYAISNRYNFDDLTKKDETRVIECWRGDCYINNFTYRLNRNFADPSLPNNDEIIDKNTWKDNYKVQEPEKWENISRSDINAVQIGSWITFKVRSAMNYALRGQDHSFVSEKALMGAPRSYYPRDQVMWKGENKLPDSYLYNDAYRATLGFKCYFTLQDVNYIKDTFSNRIQYSAISIQDSFKNNYRYSLSTYFRDYSQEYGSITKLVGFEGYLLVVFEHGIGVAVVNERVLAGGGDGEPVFINTGNVLPEELTIITDTYGSQWGESIIKTEEGFVYGVDTIAKKIWRVKGQQLEILSDFKVNKFLVDNISLGEKELYPIVGLKNVKTHYNNNKKDVMFTFYDDIYQDEEKVWNLCYNELLGGAFITFYSWLPSYSENIDTQFFTFNRKTSKYLALINNSSYNNPNAKGILLENPIFTSNSTVIHYINDIGETIEIEEYQIEKDHWGYYKHAKIENGILTYDFENSPNKDKLIILYITPIERTVTDQESNVTSINTYRTESIAFLSKDVYENLQYGEAQKRKEGITSDFYLHGQAGIIDVKETLRPTFWYNEQHPFEFEFVVNDKIAQQKIFSNLVIISNKTEPESFHFEIEGDNYDFSSDKRNMYFRQEATKNLYQNLGSDILYDRTFTDVASELYTYEQYYRGNSNNVVEENGFDKYDGTNTDYTSQYKNIDRVRPVESPGLTKQVKSTIFPLYYERVDTYNEIYDKYEEMTGAGYDFKNLSGSEIKWLRDSNQFNIVTHIKNSPIDRYGRIRGNSMYVEGKWQIQIPSLSFMQKNEDEWVTIDSNLKEGPLKEASIKIPPIVINSSYLPKDITNLNITPNVLPNIYETNQYNKFIKTIDTKTWTYRKEAKIRDKWIKIKVRYSGRNLAVIHSLITLYNISYA